MQQMSHLDCSDITQGKGQRLLSEYPIVTDMSGEWGRWSGTTYVLLCFIQGSYLLAALPPRRMSTMPEAAPSGQMVLCISSSCRNTSVQDGLADDEAAVQAWDKAL